MTNSLTSLFYKTFGCDWPSEITQPVSLVSRLEQEAPDFQLILLPLTALATTQDP